MDIAEVTGLFNMSNRMASGLGWAPNPEYESARALSAVVPPEAAATLACG